MLKLVSWNLAHRSDAWRAVVDSGADVGLLQEACAPPPGLADRILCESEPWRTGGTGANRAWRTCIAQLNPSTRLKRHSVHPIDSAPAGALAVSCGGTLVAADVIDPSTRDSYTIVSMYAPWERPHTDTSGDWIYADASAHRLVSDLSVFIGQHRHRVIASGDLNILYGHGEDGSSYWAARYRSVFDRMAAIGLQFVGPQSPNGRCADPWPDELPPSSRNVPTYHSNRQTPASATRQLDFVFASTSIASKLQVVAKNGVEEWGPSDHCRIDITVNLGA
jgi:hypothetical protein